MSTPTLTQAISTIKAGRSTEGRAMLERILATDPRNITALLWMTEVVDTPSQRREYLIRVLAIDPSNPAARKGLELLSTVAESPPGMSQVQQTKPEPQQAVAATEYTQAQSRKSRSSAWILVMLIFVLILVAAISAGMFSSRGSGSGAPQCDSEDNTTAWLAAQEFVKRRLKAPASAKFPPYPGCCYGDETTPLGNGKFKVVSYVDAENSFGAKIRTPFVAVLHHECNRWLLDSIELGE